MLGYVSASGNQLDNKEFRCATCGTFIASTAWLIAINGSHDHSFVNPSGIQCNFYTFSECENILVHERLYLEHSWFAGYGWRFAHCGQCLRHLGWKYDAVKRDRSLEGFCGILIEALEASSPED